MAGHAYPVTHSDGEWRRLLTQEQYDVMRGHGTEAPGSCALLQEKRPGTFSCAGCDLPLFGSRLTFESGTGSPSWPSWPSAGGSSPRAISAIRCRHSSDSAWHRTVPIAD